MRSRDAAEDAIRRWHAYETGRDGKPVIDFDCAPLDDAPEPYPGRFTALDALKGIQAEAEALEDIETAEHLAAHIAYLSSLLGQRYDLTDYIALTQGCGATGWSVEYLEHRAELARDALQTCGVSWNSDIQKQLRSADRQVDAGDVSSVIAEFAAEYEPSIRTLADTEAEFNLTVEDVSTDEYWSYWLDGRGHNARLRINRAKATFTRNDCYRFALHEVLGHALQYSSLSSQADANDVSWPRLLCVHCPHQVLFEGLAQVLPLIASPDDELVQAWTRLDHYTQLARAAIHLMVNDGQAIGACRQTAMELVPWWEEKDLERELRDRSQDAQLRSYLWSYPAGIDWFINLYDAGGTVLTEVVREAYKRPLTPGQLRELWPAGPVIGGGQ